MKLVNAELMRAIDAETINKRGIPGSQLMENAGRGIAERIRENILSDPGATKIAIFCGKGNNGGDGFVIGRYLCQYGCDLTIYYPSPEEKLSEDSKLNLNRARENKINLVPIESIDQLPKKLDSDLLIDAIFGTGFSGAPRGLLGEVIDYINARHLPVIAVDCPSGLNVDTGRGEGSVVQADYTYTLALPKFGLYYSPGRELSGYVEVVPIGIPDDLIESFDIDINLITYEIVYSLLPRRKPNGHKGTFGKLFILAGSTGLTGAAALSAQAANRSGLGLVSVGCPDSVNATLEIKLTEEMTVPLPDVAKKGALAKRGLGQIRKLIADADAVAIGPGVGRHFETQELIRRLVAGIEKPVLIDADGLNAFENDTEVLKNKETKTLLTPHPGEFKRIIDEEYPKNPEDQFRLVSEYAAKYNSVIVLKGSPTVIGDPDGRLFVNPTGNDGMATGGSGDVLTGIIGSLMAQGLQLFEAAICGVFIHGLAGDIAVEDIGRRSLIAGDIIDYLPSAFNYIQEFCE